MIRAGVAHPVTTATAATGLAYLATIVQQLVYARTLGLDASTDALAAALGWSIALTGVIGTTFTSVVVPAYARARARGEHTGPLASASLSLVLAFALVLAALTAAAAGPLSGALLPGSAASTTALLAQLLVLSAPLIVAWTAAIAVMAVGQARGRYAVVGYSGVVPSVVVIAVLLAARSVTPVPLAYAVGFASQAAVILVVLGREAWPALTVHLDPIRPLFRHLAPVAIGFLLINASTVVLRAILSLGGTGEVSAFDYAARLTTAIEALALSGVVAVALTIWSEDRELGGDRMSVRRTIGAGALVSVACAVAVVLLGGIVVEVLYGGGSFSGADVDSVTLSVRLIAPAMAARMIHIVAIRAVLANQASRQVAVIGATALVGVTVGGLAGSAFGYIGVLVGYDLGWAFAAVVTVVLALRAMPARPPRPTATSPASA